jgi:hypothetical protein
MKSRFPTGPHCGLRSFEVLGGSRINTAHQDLKDAALPQLLKYVHAL